MPCVRACQASAYRLMTAGSPARTVQPRGREECQIAAKSAEPARLAPKMLERFMAIDRVFIRGRKGKGA
jgi:hypothetical protein